MTWAVLVINIKGGTGKSTVAQKLSERLRDEGHSVGAFDADIDSANLSSRMGVHEKITFSGDHTVKPVEHEGIKLYSMENAFEDASFSQNGQFMREVVENMVNHSEWGDIDYMVVDCPPGSSDIFEELVRSLRANILGAVSVGISDAVEDTSRLVKVCNHNWVPILGFIENMSGMYCHGEELRCNVGGFGENHSIYPFGKGDIESYANNVGGNFIGSIPLCVKDTSIEETASDTFDNLVETIEKAASIGGPEMPEDNIGNRGFIRNLWGTVMAAKKRINEELNIQAMQDKFGVEGRDPLVIKLELSDATGLADIISEVVITVSDGKVKFLRPNKAVKSGIDVEGGIRMTSQVMYDSMRNEKTVMNSVTGDIITIPYSIVDAVRMGDADIWGDRTINRLAVLDKILSEAISMDEFAEMVEQK